MKAGIVGAAALGLASFAIAHEHHHARHAQFHQHRDVHVETVTDYVTVEKEEIVVYLDEDGKPVKTSTFYSGVETPTPAPAPKPATSQAAPPKVSSVVSKVAADFHQVVPSVSIPSPSIPKPSVPSSSGGSLPGPSTGNGFGRGLSYSPYNNDNSCKSASQVASDLSGIIGQFDMVRIYGVDCNQVSNTIQALAGKNVRIMSGVFDVGSWQSETQQIIDAVKNNAGGNWGIIHTVSIGNEAVNSGTASVGEVTSAVSGARSMLRSAGFQGPVVTVDTMIAFQNNPELVSTSDFLAMNCHPFFDPNTDAQGAGEFVQGWIQKLGGVANGKLIAITETGWPKCGSPNGKAVGTPQNQQTALSSLKGAMSSNMVLYSAYDQLWKQNNANTFNAEQCWGMFN